MFLIPLQVGLLGGSRSSTPLLLGGHDSFHQSMLDSLIRGASPNLPIFTSQPSLQAPLPPLAPLPPASSSGQAAAQSASLPAAPPAPAPIAFKSEEVAAMQKELAQIMMQQDPPSLRPAPPSSQQPPTTTLPRPAGVIQPTPINPAIILRALTPNSLAAANAAEQLLVAQVQAAATSAAFQVASAAHAAVMAGSGVTAAAVLEEVKNEKPEP